MQTHALQILHVDVNSLIPEALESPHRLDSTAINESGSSASQVLHEHRAGAGARLATGGRCQVVPVAGSEIRATGA